MTTTILISLCVLVLLAYVFDVSSQKTKIPTVILLLLLGWVTRQVVTHYDIVIPDLSNALQLLGTVGLILIVMEGSLELELNKDKYPLIGKATIVSLLPLVIFTVLVAWAFSHFTGRTFLEGIANALPFAVISSSIAIPSSKNLPAAHREFVVYESSMSDIFGVLLFNFVTTTSTIDVAGIGSFFLGIAIITIISFVASVGLAYLLKSLNSHVKFFPIFVIVLLVYSLSKIIHLPGLLFILIFGLVLGNLDEFKKYKIIERLRPDILNKEVHRFKEVAVEITFLIRVLFFILFGFLIETKEVLDGTTLAWSFAISTLIFVLRAGFLAFYKLPLNPLLFVAPRGLITVLLFLSIPTSMLLPLVAKSMLIQVILITALMMMVGSFLQKKTDVVENH